MEGLPGTASWAYHLGVDGFDNIREAGAPWDARFAFRPDRQISRSSTHQLPGGASFSITWSRLKLAAFWRGGYSWNVARKLPT